MSKTLDRDSGGKGHALSSPTPAQPAPAPAYAPQPAGTRTQGTPGTRPLVTPSAPPPGVPLTAQRKAIQAALARMPVYDGPLQDWTNAVFRPDLYQRPVLGKSGSEAGHGEPIQRAAAETSAQSAPPAAASGSGQALPEDVRGKMEGALGADFSAVRVHQGSQATAMGALAYTQGTDIHFAPGQYNPGSRQGQELLGHELTHVVQQAQGRVQATAQLRGVNLNNDAALEREADEMGAKAAAGSAAALDGGTAALHPAGGSKAAQRKPLRQSIREALGEAPEPGHASAASQAPVQCKLIDDLRGMIDIHGPVHYEGVIRAIHAAPAAERQEVLNDAGMRDLINRRLSGAWAQSVMSSLMEGSQRWQNPTNNNFFDYFVTRGGTGTLPNTATMNCWESIMYAAYLANQVTANWIASFYQQALGNADPNAAVWTQLGFSRSLPTYAAPGTTVAGSVTPRTGQLLFYIGNTDSVPGHVAVSLGGDQAISLWNQPNNVDAVQRIRVTDLAGTVYVGNPPW